MLVTHGLFVLLGTVSVHDDFQWKECRWLLVRLLIAVS